MKSSLPSRGEIWLANLSPTAGREKSGTRPCLIVSVDVFNHGPAELVIVVPLTSRHKSIPLHVRVQKGEGNLDNLSYAKPEDIRSVSKSRLTRKIGSVNANMLNEVLDRIRILLDI